VIYPIENELWMVNLGGAGNESPPTDDDAFLDFTRTFIHPAFYQAIKDAEPASPVYAYQRTENRLRHFERLTHWPEHFVLLGDAACAFNPIYGQGMTVAALEAEALDKWIQTSQSGLLFEKQIMDVVRAPWLMATNEDSRLPGVEGAASGRADKLFQNYVDQVIWLCSTDPFAFEAFMSVTHLIKPPSALLHPHIASRVLRRMLRREQPHGRSTDPIPPAPSTGVA
jgi:flavin-dependent dehydrogenase